jgi:hypothetical protein
VLAAISVPAVIVCTARRFAALGAHVKDSAHGLLF